MVIFGIMGRVNSGNSVNIGIMVMFCIKRIEKVEWFLGVCISFFLLSVWRIIVVDDRVKIKLMVSVID